MAEDLDVNDDGLVDCILPTKPCWDPALSPIPSHGHHTYKTLAGRQNAYLCRGYPWPDGKEDTP